MLLYPIVFIGDNVDTYQMRYSDGLVFREACSGRREGTVLMRTSGKTAITLYLYSRLPRSLAHTVVGHVVHGIELCKIAQEGDRVFDCPHRSTH